MHRITWPVGRGSKTITFWNPRPRFAYSLYKFCWAPTTIKGRLLSSRPTFKPFSGEKILSRRNWAPKWRFGESQGLNFRYWLRDPQRHFLARNRVVWRIFRQNRCTRLGCSLSLKHPKSSRVTFVPRGAKSRMRRTETPKPIWITFGQVIDISDIVTDTNLVIMGYGVFG